MRKATQTAAAWLGITAGAAGIEHGIFEILRGNTRPEGLVISSIGPPCNPEEVWNACEPALTIVPNFLITGILAVFLGLMVLLWSAFFLKRKGGGFVLMLLSVLLLLFGGGFFPPLIGLVGGAAGLSIRRPVRKRSLGPLTRFAARLWPWPLVIFLVWLLAQWLVGYFFNEFMMRAIWFGLAMILAPLLLSVSTASAQDLFNTNRSGAREGRKE